MGLIHCIYASEATDGFVAHEQLPRILATARQENSTRNITGMLLHASGSFFQVLEGRDVDVDALLSRIAMDPRHRSVTVIIREVIATRAFADWTMGFVELTEQEMSALVGYNDFFANRHCMAEIGPGRAKKLLHAFAKGRWRARLDGLADRNAA